MSSNAPQTPMAATITAGTEPEQPTTISYGNMDFLSVVFRAAAGELFKIRRRTMSKVLGIIAFVTMLLTFLVLSLPAFVSSASKDSNPLAQQSFEGAAAILHLPEALNVGGTIVTYIGPILLIILAGTIVGGEYGAGTIRIMLTRGPSRVQFLLAKMIAMLVSTIIAMIGMLLIGIICGTILSLALGVPTSFQGMTGTWITHALLYIAAIALGLFSYTLLATGFATLGKSTAAGITGAIIWWFLDMFGILTNILKGLGNIISGSFGDFLKAVPDYLLGNNLSVITQNQAAYMYDSPSSSSTSDLHAILVVIVYLVVFIAITCWIQLSRDVTE